MEEKQFEYECATCGIKFYRPYHKACKYCSKECRRIGTRKNDKSRRDEKNRKRKLQKERNITNFILKAKAEGLTYEQAQIKESLKMMWEKNDE